MPKGQVRKVGQPLLLAPPVASELINEPLDEQYSRNLSSLPEHWDDPSRPFKTATYDVPRELQFDLRASIYSAPPGKYIKMVL